MEIGGAERALIGLLRSIDYSMHQVDLFLMGHTGEFMELIPSEVNLLKEDSKAACIAAPIAEPIRKGYYDIVMGRLIGKIFSSIYKRGNTQYYNVSVDNSVRFTYRYLEDLNPDTNYDLAISFLAPHYIVANRVKAKYKIAWIHCDYSSILINKKVEYRTWKKYDRIAAVSKDNADSFTKTFPELSDKIVKIENINCPELIWKQANAYNVSSEMTGTIIILSVGRFDPARNFSKIPQMCKRIIDGQYDVVWYIIGYGNEEERERIINNRKKYHVEKNVVLLGKKENPYPYIKQCDIFVMPSSDEGKSVAVIEAQILCKPVIITNYPSAKSQLRDGFDGIICPMDFDACADSIVELLSDREKMKKLQHNCEMADYSNSEDFKRLLNAVEKNINLY